MPVDVAEATSAPADTGDSGSTEVTDNYVSSVLLPGDSESFSGDEGPGSGQEVTRTADNQTETTAADSAAETTDATTGVEASKVEDPLQALAKEMGLDPTNPRDQKVLKRLVDKDSFIKKLQGENKDLRDGADSDLTAFERELLSRERGGKTAAAKPGTTQAKPGTEAARPAAEEAPAKVGDIGDSWKSPEDAYKALNEAWVANDLAKVREIDNAMFFRRFAAMGVPLVNAMLQERVNQILEQRLGPVLKEVSPMLDQQSEIRSRDFAIAELKKTEKFADIESLLEPDQEGTLNIDGDEFPNNPLNRIVMENPDLLSIRRDHENPNVAKALTKIAIYKAAHRIHKAQQKNVLDPAKARELVDAGQKIARRAAADKVRQGLNAGSSGGRGPQGDGSYVEELVKGRSGAPVPFGSLID